MSIFDLATAKSDVIIPPLAQQLFGPICMHTAMRIHLETVKGKEKMCPEHVNSCMFVMVQLLWKLYNLLST